MKTTTLALLLLLSCFGWTLGYCDLITILSRELRGAHVILTRVFLSINTNNA